MRGSSTKKLSGGSKATSAKTKKSSLKRGKKLIPRTDIQYGDVSIPEEAFEDKNVKIRITTFIDMDLYKLLKAEANQGDAKYQTLLNHYLRVGTEIRSKVTEVMHKIEKDLIVKAVLKTMENEAEPLSQKVATLVMNGMHPKLR